jgi:mannose-6-phosphate isomerase-like protein (cupin superfamily)
MISMTGLIVTSNEADEHLTDERCHILEYWNRPDDPEMSIARARVSPGITTQRHRLIGIVERYLILDGEGSMELQGSAPRPVGVGDVVYIPAGQVQSITNTGKTDLVFLAICNPRFVPAAYVMVDEDSL